MIGLLLVVLYAGLLTRTQRQGQGLDRQGQGPRTSVEGQKSRTFELARIYHAANTKLFQGTGVVRILQNNAILFIRCIGRRHIMTTIWCENNLHDVARGDAVDTQNTYRVSRKNNPLWCFDKISVTNGTFFGQILHTHLLNKDTHVDHFWYLISKYTWYDNIFII